jgi:hypothetical protein
MPAAAPASTNRINRAQRTLRSWTAANEADGSLAETVIAVNLEVGAANLCTSKGRERPICTNQSISLD